MTTTPSLSPLMTMMSTTTATTDNTNSNTVTPPPTHEKQQQPAPPEWLQEVAVIHHAPCPCCNHVAPTTKKETIAQEEEQDFLPGVLHSGVSYTPKQCLAEGYIHLKGSGQDMFGSRAWKPRYARLVLATVQGIDTPLLLIYWFQSSVDPSTVITLDSTVVMPADKEDKEQWNAYSVNVVHVSSKNNKRTTRTFTAGSQQSRDSWLLVLNQALLEYEKRKRKSTRSSIPKSPPPPRWNEERFVTTTLPPPPPPQLGAVSPSYSSEKRPLPRPEEPLAGEFLSEDNYWLD